MESLPEDIQIEILLRMPLKSLLACRCVCRKLKTIICGEEFQNRYLLRSMTRPMDPTPDSLFRTVCQRENPFEEWMRSAPVRGVVCLQSTTWFLLCSPITTNDLHLPDFEGHEQLSEIFFLGCDEATRVLKVLCSRITYKPQVYTVSSGGEGSWRPVACERRHLAFVRCTLCKGGVLYYAAKALQDLESIVVCFNVSSETFEYNQLPERFWLRYDSTMVNYDGKVALVSHKSDTGEFQICVRDEVSGEWELQRLVIPDWRDNVEKDLMFSFQGTIGTGELVFKAPTSLLDGSESVLHYNPNPPQGKKKFNMFRVGAVNGGSYHYVRACLNHFDSRFRIN